MVSLCGHKRGGRLKYGVEEGREAADDIRSGRHALIGFERHNNVAETAKTSEPIANCYDSAVLLLPAAVPTPAGTRAGISDG